MRGFGGFSALALLIVLLMFEFSWALERLGSGVSETAEYDLATSRLGLFRNVIMKSSQYAHGDVRRAWEIEVANELARRYGMDVFIDGHNVTIIDGRNSISTVFAIP